MNYNRNHANIQVGVCYRDSPCNEQGTDGGNKNGCSLTEVSFCLTFFKTLFCSLHLTGFLSSIHFSNVSASHYGTVTDANGLTVHVKMEENVGLVFVENVLINQNALVRTDLKVQCAKHRYQRNVQQRLQCLEQQLHELLHQDLLHQEQLHRNKLGQLVRHDQISLRNGDHGQLGLNVTTGLIIKDHLFNFHF